VSSESPHIIRGLSVKEGSLAGEASGSSISNCCQAKTERRRQLAGLGTGRRGTKLHASVAGSRVTEFLATAAPWEPYFADNPRILSSNLYLVVLIYFCFRLPLWSSGHSSLVPSPTRLMTTFCCVTVLRAFKPSLPP
jgi:hypothetical protein